MQGDIDLLIELIIIGYLIIIRLSRTQPKAKEVKKSKKK